MLGGVSEATSCGLAASFGGACATTAAPGFAGPGPTYMPGAPSPERLPGPPAVPLASASRSMRSGGESGPAAVSLSTRTRARRITRSKRSGSSPDLMESPCPPSLGQKKRGAQTRVRAPRLRNLALDLLFPFLGGLFLVLLGFFLHADILLRLGRGPQYRPLALNFIYERSALESREFVEKKKRGYLGIAPA